MSRARAMLAGDTTRLPGALPIWLHSASANRLVESAKTDEVIAAIILSLRVVRTEAARGMGAPSVPRPLFMLGARSGTSSRPSIARCGRLRSAGGVAGRDRGDRERGDGEMDARFVDSAA